MTQDTRGNSTFFFTLLTIGMFAVSAYFLRDIIGYNVIAFILLTSVISGITTYRLRRGQTPFPTYVLALVGVAALAGYVLAWGKFDQPTGFEWVYVAIVFSIPVALLIMAYRQWRAQR